MTEENSEVSVESSANTEPEQEPKSTNSTVNKQTLREKLENLPASIDKAIDEGKGNTFIEKIQTAICTLATSIFNSSKQAAVQLYLLSDEQKKQVSKIMYIVAFICALGCCVSLIFSMSLKTIIFAGCFILGAYLADIVVQSTSLKSSAKKQKRSKQKQSSDEDNDIL